jgi:D-alanine-D-alanine ligase-like ATP-grasp enzyme
VDKLNLGVIFGGCSEEHFISVKSAREVAKSLDPRKYQPFYVGITQSGVWKFCDGPTHDWEASGFNSYECEWWRYTLADEPYPHTYFDFPIA